MWEVILGNAEQTERRQEAKKKKPKTKKTNKKKTPKALITQLPLWLPRT